MGARLAKAGISMVPAWLVSSLYGRCPLDSDAPKWCFALRNGMRTTVRLAFEGMPGGEAAGDEPGLDTCGAAADRGNLW